MPGPSTKRESCRAGGMGKKERAEERQQRREERLQEIARLRQIPYTDAQRWWSSETIAVVTGSNRGIGYEIARSLAAHGLTVILAARDPDKGDEAKKSLQDEGLEVVFHQLDVCDSASVEQFANWITVMYGGIDILVNNAGVNFNLGFENSVEFAEEVMATNYFGTRRMIETMIPLMKPSASGARIVNVSSRLGRLNGRRNRLGDVNLRNKLAVEESLSEEVIEATINKFLEQVKDGSWISGGWPQNFTDYSVSKLAVNAYTRLMAKKNSDRPEGHKIFINCFCPGWVKTAMTGWQGNISAEEAADTGVWVALQPTEPTTGNFFAERREISF
ncbi:hypothetical protein H6P81_013421 [Aristolochia fimbriata]|uniref:Short-chain dehydrogenase/reductase n=1 Tax=Aristolochia fimbriata TaxID=158543 RepID=A0AAV7EEN0_ARIFI|nr:hypothetical protein H6P81_013421 [Aristolochia fimbriata]